MARYLEKGEVSKSVCGTKQYMAPEMIEQKGHSFTLDWWTLGIFLYEMLFGAVPFLTGEISEDKLLRMIKSKKVKFPPLQFLTKRNPITQTCQDFITELLVKNPRHRLGAKNDAEEIL